MQHAPLPIDPSLGCRPWTEIDKARLTGCPKIERCVRVSFLLRCADDLHQSGTPVAHKSSPERRPGYIIWKAKPPSSSRGCLYISTWIARNMTTSDQFLCFLLPTHSVEFPMSGCFLSLVSCLISLRRLPSPQSKQQISV
jgi:hypothetical protein